MDLGLFSKKHYWYDIHNHDLSVEYENARIERVEVYGTDEWLFSLQDYDSKRAKKAADKIDLPDEVQIITNSCRILFSNDCIEYGLVKMLPL